MTTAEFQERITRKTYRLEIIPAIIAGAAAIGSAAMNYASQQEANKQNKKIAEQNLQLQQEQLEYQKALQKEIFAREDTAHQREVTDLRNSGISPLATANGGAGAGSGAVVPLTERQNNYQAQAPQVDLSGIATAAQLYESGRANRAGEDIARDQLTQKRESDEAQLALEKQKEQNRKMEANQNYELELRKQGENERANQVHEKIMQQQADTSTYQSETARKTYELARAKFENIELPASIDATKEQKERIELIKKQVEQITSNINSQNLHDKIDTANAIINGAKGISSEIREWLFGSIGQTLKGIVQGLKNQ